MDGQTVRLELDVQERDKYGRLLAYVYVDDMMVNAEQVAQGYAQVMTIPPNVKHQELFLKLRREARLLQLGRWKGAGPPPASRQGSPELPRAAPPASGRPGVPNHAPDQGQLHHVVGRAVHLSPAEWRVLRQDEA